MTNHTLQNCIRISCCCGTSRVSAGRFWQGSTGSTHTGQRSCELPAPPLLDPAGPRWTQLSVGSHPHDIRQSEADRGRQTEADRVRHSKHRFTHISHTVQRLRGRRSSKVPSYYHHGPLGTVVQMRRCRCPFSIVHVENHTLIGMRPTSPDDAPNPGVCIYIYVYHFQYSVSQNSGVDVVAAGSKLVAKETN